MTRISPQSRQRAQIARELMTASRTITAADKREARGIVEGASYTWAPGKCFNPRGGSYYTSEGYCTCPDFQNNGAELGFCKHIAALRIYAPDEPLQPAREPISPERIARLFGNASG